MKIVEHHAMQKFAPQPREIVFSKIAIAGLGTRILELGRGERLTLIGIGYDGIGDTLKSTPIGTRSALLLGLNSSRSADAVLNRLLDDLADVALDRWPRWYGRDQPNGDGLFQHAIADRLVSGPWVRAAAKRAAVGRRPRFRKSSPAFEFGQLMRALVPSDPVLVAAIDPTSIESAAPVIQVLEWCAARDTSVVATFPTHPPSVTPYDRVLYGALEVIREVEPALTRFIASARAHHASAIEQRVEAALRRDSELGPLFSCNQTVAIGGLGSPPRVDLLWRNGRVVVELDGPDHQIDPKFANDRHRDYELLVAGYLVLRITNDQVDTDLQSAIEKIRAVVRFRKSLGN
jgi:very-short-patch-repair endonuclease